MGSSAGISFALWRMAVATVHGIGHGAIEDVRPTASRPCDMAERRDRRRQSQCAGWTIGHTFDDLSSRRRLVGRIIDRAAVRGFFPDGRRHGTVAGVASRLRPGMPPDRCVERSGLWQRTPGTDFRGGGDGSDVSLRSAQIDDGAIVPKLRGHLWFAQHDRAPVLGLWAPTAQAIALGCVFPVAPGRTNPDFGRDRRRGARLDRCPRRGAAVCNDWRVTAAGELSDIQRRLRSWNDRRRSRGHACETWGGDISVGFSGVVRAGDPFSLVADDAQLRRIHFGWQIPVDQGIAAYVQWFKEHVR